MNLKDLKSKLNEKFKSQNLGLVHIDDVISHIEELENTNSKSTLTDKAINTYVERKKKENQ